jgi:hypothetical protein
MLGESFQNIWQQILMTDEKAYENFLSFSMTIATTLLSVGVSVFTLTTAFIVSKKDSLNELGTQVEEGGQSLTLARRMNALRRFIKTMKSVTKMSMTVVISSVLSILLVIVFRNLSAGAHVHLLTLTSVLSVVFTVMCIWVLFKWFIKQ